MRQITLIFFLVAGLFALPSVADQNNPELDDLFSRLHETVDVVEAAEITKQIWQNWYQSNDSNVSKLMQLGEVSMRQAKYDEAVALITRTRQASISMVQRHLRIGYNRAARIIETMEQEGLVGPSDGAKAREVLVRGYEDID